MLWRALNNDLSSDHFAHLWITKNALRSSIRAWKKLKGSKSIVCCLRNRFFLEALIKFEKEHNEIAFVNVGAGFSSYSYNIRPQSLAYEIDLKSLILYKSKQTRTLEIQGVLPKRKIQFLAMALNRSDELVKFQELLISLRNSKKTLFCLIGRLTCLTSREFCYQISNSFLSCK